MIKSSESSQLKQMASDSIIKALNIDLFLNKPAFMPMKKIIITAKKSSLAGLSQN